MIGAIRRYFARRRIEGILDANVSPQAVQQMVERGSAPESAVQEREITPFFADIAAFPVFAEKMNAAQLVEATNAWLEACATPIAAQGGCIDKFIGCAVVAMFGAPLAVPNHAARACAAAALVQEEAEKLRQRFVREGRWPATMASLRGRIGLHTGMAIVGNIGTRMRISYTMMGESVNLASRLEQGANAFGVGALCSETTHAQCRRDSGEAIVFRSLGRVVVRGREQPLKIFEIAGRREIITDRTRECIALFEQGLARYEAKDWDGAIAQFDRSAPLEPSQPDKAKGVRTNPSIVFMERARLAKANPDALSPFF